MPSASDYWIGANYLMMQSWAWSDGTLMSYSNFAVGQQPDPSYYQCAYVRVKDNGWVYVAFLVFEILDI